MAQIQYKSPYDILARTPVNQTSPSFEELIETIDIDEIGIKEKLQEEVRRFKKFQQMTLGRNDDIAIREIDVRNYAKYLLREGTDIEKRELLGCLKGKITLQNKKIDLIPESHKV